MATTNCSFSSFVFAAVAVAEVPRGILTLSSLDSFTAAAAVAVAVAVLSLAKWPPSDDLLLLDSSSVCAGFCLRMFFFCFF